MKTKDLEEPKLKRVRALTDGVYYLDAHDGLQSIRLRKDDVFTLFEYPVTICHTEGLKRGEPKLNPKTGKPEMRMFTLEEQFSPRWMEEVPMSTPESRQNPQAAINARNEEIKKNLVSA
jgi:hypothetical protein